jgi:hypothetical protein
MAGDAGRGRGAAVISILARAAVLELNVSSS